jgi:uncharacterized damage-inducible protein DinB
MGELAGLRTHARMLMAYSAWANATVLDAMAQVSDAQLNDGDGGRGGIAGTMRHVVSAQLTWWSRWTGKEQPHVDASSLDGLREAFEAADTLLIDYARSMSNDDWSRELEYRDSRGVEQREPIGWLITHVANHGTLHRGEAGLLLARYGHSPGDLDFVFWARDHWRP